MATYDILYWHDIPIQVRAKDENGRVGKQLPERFQEAIDEAAMSAKMTGDELYMEGFRWGGELERDGSAEDVANQIVAELDQEYDPIDWKATAEKLRKA